MKWPFRRRQAEVLDIPARVAYAVALGFLRAGGVLTLREYVKLAPGLQQAFQEAGRAFRAEMACAVARASLGPLGFAEVQRCFDEGSTPPEALIGEAILDGRMHLALSDTPQGVR